MNYQRKPIPDFPGYEIDTEGNIWSCKKLIMLPRNSEGKITGTKSIITNEWRKLKLSTDKDGYLFVHLRKDKKHCSLRISRLMLEVFTGQFPVKMLACHNDGNILNNSLENLRWDTQKGNKADELLHGTRQRGEKHHYASLTEKQIRVIKWALFYGNKVHGIKRYLARTF